MKKQIKINDLTEECKPPHDRNMGFVFRGEHPGEDLPKQNLIGKKRKYRIFNKATKRYEFQSVTKLNYCDKMKTTEEKLQLIKMINEEKESAERKISHLLSKRERGLVDITFPDPILGQLQVTANPETVLDVLNLLITCFEKQRRACIERAEELMK